VHTLFPSGSSFVADAFDAPIPLDEDDENPEALRTQRGSPRSSRSYRSRARASNNACRANSRIARTCPGVSSTSGFLGSCLLGSEGE
jgi:hypothetical protein